MAHKAGFVNIIGKPNAGKSTLMNRLVGEKLSIITAKAQTTRHRILGIVNGADFQVVYSDTPGIIKPRYKMQEAMMQFVSTSLEDADILLFLTATDESYEAEDPVLQQLQSVKVPVLLLLNKTDLADEATVTRQLEAWKTRLKAAAYLPVSALKGDNTDRIFDLILQHLPESPSYYPKDTLTDKPEKFFVAEIIREKIFTNYKQEVPYSTEVVVESFKEEEALIRISAEIYVNRKSQKPILIGKGGQALKKIGTAARKDIEAFLGKQVYLELYVKVREDWRNKDTFLKNFGYKH